MTLDELIQKIDVLRVKLHRLKAGGFTHTVSYQDAEQELSLLRAAYNKLRRESNAQS